MRLQVKRTVNSIQKGAPLPKDLDFRVKETDCFQKGVTRHENKTWIKVVRGSIFIDPAKPTKQLTNPLTGL